MYRKIQKKYNNILTLIIYKSILEKTNHIIKVTFLSLLITYKSDKG